MRLCRYRSPQSDARIGLYSPETVRPLEAVIAAYNSAHGGAVPMPSGDNLLDWLPGGRCEDAGRKLEAWLASGPQHLATIGQPRAELELLLPVPRPNKLLLLAGNYARHIEETGGKAEERAATFPYVFMKPPSTTLVPDGSALQLPAVAPDHCDWELELAVVIGKTAHRVSETEALDCVAGYTIINDISQRQFRPNPQRTLRERDKFFDWLHGKWFDGFCPCGPCVLSARGVEDPQQFDLELKLNGQVRQASSTAAQVFPVAAVIEFVSQIMTLEPGDVISTGTPAGVGHASGSYLRPGDRLEASISTIGTLTTPVA